MPSMKVPTAASKPGLLPVVPTPRIRRVPPLEVLFELYTAMEGDTSCRPYRS